MGFRAIKLQLSQMLDRADWEACVAEIVSLPGNSAVGSLFSLLAGNPKANPALSWRAAVALGFVVQKIAHENMEEARICMRRLMWHMNEESGNIGWGIPEAMGEVLVRHEGLAKEYSHILLSYVWDTGKEDNFCDHGPLRQSVFNALGRMVTTRFSYMKNAGTVFVTGLEDAYIPACGAAAFALEQLCHALIAVRSLDEGQNKQEAYLPAALCEKAILALNTLATEQTECSLFVGSELMAQPVSFWAERAQRAVLNIG